MPGAGDVLESLADPGEQGVGRLAGLLVAMVGVILGQGLVASGAVDQVDRDRRDDRHERQGRRRGAGPGAVPARPTGEPRGDRIVIGADRLVGQPVLDVIGQHRAEG